MSIADAHQYAVSKEKLAHVRELLARMKAKGGRSPETHAASLRSVRAFANQLVEELTRYEATHGIDPLPTLRSVLTDADAAAP